MFGLWLCLAAISLATEIHRVELYRHDADEVVFWYPRLLDAFTVDTLRLAPGQPITAQPATNDMQALTTQFRQPQLAMFALEITRGDPELLRQARHQFPEFVPSLKPVEWRPLPTSFTNRVITAATTGLADGAYRIRLVAADATNAIPRGAGVWGDFFVVIARSPHSLDLYTDQCRRVYFRGESVPLTILLRSTATLPSGRAAVRLVRSTGFSLSATVAISAITNENRRELSFLETRDLAPGAYALTVEYAGMSASWPVEIVEPVGPSVIAISENQIAGSPFADTVTSPASFGFQPVDTFAHFLERPYADVQVTSFRNELRQQLARRADARLAETLEAVRAGPAAERIGVHDLRQLWMDGMTRQRMGYWAGVQTRGLSFSKANTLPGTEDEIRRRLVAISRDFGAWANYLGPLVDADCGAVKAGEQLNYVGLTEPMVKAHNERLARAQEAAFRAAGASDAPLGEPWGNWYRGVWPRADAKDRAALALLSPSLLRTANREYHHGRLETGQYPPDLYREMDVQHVEAWGDALDNVLFADSWANLGAAARRATGRADQPLWIETQSYFGDTPGYLQTRWWGALANGADGVGYAANCFGLRGYSGIEPHRANFRRQTAAAMARMVRTLGPTLRVLERERRVAVLLSKTEADRHATDFRYNVHCFDSYPPFVSFFALTMAGYQPDFILDENILDGELDRYRVLYLTWQQAEMPAAMKARVDAFVARGGTVAMDAMCKRELFPKAVAVDVNPDAYRGPHGLNGTMPWEWMDESVRTLRATLDPLVTMPGRVEHPRCIAYWLRRAESTYCLVINEDYAPLQTTLTLARPMGGYDLLTGQRIEPTTKLAVDLRNVHARLYAFMPAAVGSLEVRATQKATAGGRIAMTASFLDRDGKSLHVIAPATFSIADSEGRVRWERWMPIGPGMPAATWDTAATEVPGTYTATVRELLSGKTMTFPIQMKAQNVNLLINKLSNYETFTSEDRRSLGTLWHTKGATWSVIARSDHAALDPLAAELMRELRRRGLNAQLWRDPETIPMPVGYLFTPAEEQSRQRVFAGEAIGERFYLHAKEAPYADTWEERTGTAIYRNVIFLELGNESGIRVGVRQFSGNHDAVFLRGKTKTELRQLVREALALRPTNEQFGPEPGRVALGRGYLLSNHRDEPGKRSPSSQRIRGTVSEQPITWADQLGRPIEKIDLSPNGQHLLVTHQGMFNVAGQFAADGAPARAFVRKLRGDRGHDLLGVDDQGAVEIEVDAYWKRLLRPDGAFSEEQPKPLWQSSDGRQSLRYEPFIVEEKDGQGKSRSVTKRKLIRQHEKEIVFSSELLGSLPGDLRSSSNGAYLFQPDDGLHPGIKLGDRFATMHDGLTGKRLWQKKGWWVYPGLFASSIAWSSDGEFIALVRNYPNADYHGRNPPAYHRSMLSLVRARDGEVVAEGAPSTWSEKILVGAGTQFVVGVPAFMADHYWLLDRDKGLTKVKATEGWLYDVELDSAGRQVFTLDLDGVLRRHQPTGEVLWSKQLRTAAGPLLGILKALGQDVLLGSTTGRLYRLNGNDGSIMWERMTTDSL